MNLAWATRRHRAPERPGDDDTDLDPADADGGTGDTGRSTAASAVDQVTATVATKAASVLLVAALFTGPLGLTLAAVAITHPGSSTTAGPVRVAGRADDQAVAGEFAQRLVVTWLATTRERPDALVALIPGVQDQSLPATPYTVADPTVADITDNAGVWSVTVAVTVTDIRHQDARRFYRVPVIVTTSAGAPLTVTAVTLPTPVAAPIVTSPPRLGYDTLVDPTGPVAATVAGFLTAYTTGQGDVTRYVSPGATLPAITPAPFTAVHLDGLSADRVPAAAPGDGQVLRVLVTATGTVAAGQVSPVSYALTLTARADRWEVTAIDLTPLLATPPTTTTTSGVTAPATPLTP